MPRPSHAPAVERSSAAPSGAVAVLALALAAAGIGFAIFVYAVPYRRVATTLKRRSGELRAAQTQASARAKEIERMRQDMVDVRGVTDGAGAARPRTDVGLLRSEIEQGLAVARAQVALDRGRLRVRLPEDAVFEARGADLSRAGQQALQVLAQVLSDRASRVLIAAPMGSHLPPRWLRAQYPTPVDLSAARSGSALRALVKGGARAPAMMAVIGMLEPSEESADATLDVEIEPHR